MRTRRKQLYVLMAAGLVGLASCDKNVFNLEDYEEIMKQESPVGDIDSTQTWQMAQRHTVDVTVNAAGVSAQQLLILAPTQSANSYEVLTQLYVSNGQRVSASFSAPIIVKQLYAAVYDGRTYTLQPFAAGQSAVDFSEVSPELSERTLSLSQQGYTYCFEDGMPVPGDYDYNDLVLRVVKERTGERELKLNVTLAAVGSTTPMGAAIRLVGVQFSDVESVTTDGSRYQFVGDYPMSPVYLENSVDTLQESKSGEAVIALFEDAHWALDGRNLDVSNGYFVRFTYNTLRVNNATAKQRTPRVVTYTLTFKSAEVLDSLVMDDIDPFVMKDYNGGIWEVHIPVYASAQVLWNYNLPEVTIMPWAVAVPSSVFRYSLEGKCLGAYKDNAISGAYMVIGHSFGQWAANQENSQDWYLYPSNGQVY